MIVLGIIIAGLAAYLVYALVYPEKLQLKTHEEEDNNVSEIVLVCSASVILTSQAIQQKHSIEFYFLQGRKGQQSIAVKGFSDNYLSYCTMQN